MTYYVHRSHLVFDEDVHVCVARGIDNRSPGELVAVYSEEGEYENALEAADAALAIATRTGEVIALGSGNSLGLYSSASDPIEPAELVKWARACDEQAQLDADEDREQYLSAFDFDGEYGGAFEVTSDADPGL